MSAMVGRGPGRAVRSGAGLAALAAALLAAMLAAPHPAHAYPTGSQFDADPLTQDGAGGLLFTGAPRFTGHACEVCHLNPPRRIGVTVEASAEDLTLFDTGYQPGKTYPLRVALTNEWAGTRYGAGDACGLATTPYVPCNDNGFALEVDDAGGQPVGSYQPVVVGQGCVSGPAQADDFDVHVSQDGSGVTERGRHHGVTTWDFCWTAPAAGTGTVTAYVAAVDGSGGDGTMQNPNDNINDDVFAAALPLTEAGAASNNPPAGCEAAAGGGGRGRRGVAAGLVVLVALGGLALLAGGCATVKPYQREHLAQRIMKFSPDPDEDQLDLHMLEAREGSSGGYGSAGGGCGCN